MNIIESLRTWYEEAIDNSSSADGLEPEYECNYCHHRDVGPAHADECIAVDCMLAADEIERLRVVARASSHFLKYRNNAVALNIALEAADLAAAE
jgi:hypothetical protein